MTLLGPFQGSKKGSKKGSKRGDKKGSKKCHFGHLFGDLFGHLLAKYGGVTLSGNDPSDGVSNVNQSPMDMTHLGGTPDHGPGPSEGDLDPRNSCFGPPKQLF